MARGEVFEVHPAEARATEFLRGALRSAIIFLKTRALPRRGRTNQPGAERRGTSRERRPRW